MLIVILCRLVSEAHSAESFDGQTFYFGDLHAHTGVSPDGGSSDYDQWGAHPCYDQFPDDGIDPPCGSLAGVFDAARDTYHLDFVSFTDHSVADASLFDTLLQRGLDATTPTFVVIPGAERVLHYDGITAFGDVGHKTNLVFQDDLENLASLDVLDFRGTTYDETKKFGSCGDVWKHPEHMADEFGPVLEFAHHPAAGKIMVTDWSCHNQTYEPVVEIYSGWGNSLRVDNNYDRVEEPVEESSVIYGLEWDDLRVGFVGGTDIHDTRPGAVCAIDSSGNQTHMYGGGLTVVALPDGGEFKRSAIYDELVARRSLVTTGPQMPVSVHWITPNRTPEGVTHSIGEELVVHHTAGQATILSVKIPSGGPAYWSDYVMHVRAIGYTAMFELTESVEGEWSVAIPNDLLPKWLYVEVEIDGASFYEDIGGCPDSPPVDADGYFAGDGTVDNREFVWSSPVWFDWGTDLDGDGYAYDVNDCNDYNAAIHPGLRDRPDGIDRNCDGRETPPSP
jgi:hypothetical protein